MFNRRATRKKEDEAQTKQGIERARESSDAGEMLVKVVQTYLPGTDTGLEGDKNRRKNKIRVRVEPIDRPSQGFTDELAVRSFVVQQHPDVMQQNYTTTTAGGGHLDGRCATLRWKVPQIASTGKIYLEGETSYGEDSNETDFSGMYTVQRFQLPLL
jgi:hypothetical protein